MLTHFVVSDDMVGSWRFYADVPGGKTAIEGEPPVSALANNRIIINTRGGHPRQAKHHPSGPAGRAPDGLISPAAAAITST